MRTPAAQPDEQLEGQRRRASSFLSALCAERGVRPPRLRMSNDHVIAGFRWTTRTIKLNVAACAELTDAELRYVLAQQLSHVVHRHGLKTFVAAAAAAIVVVLGLGTLFLPLLAPLALALVPISQPLAVVVYEAGYLAYIAGPPLSASATMSLVSRPMEIEADRSAVAMTGDPEAAASFFVTFLTHAYKGDAAKIEKAQLHNTWLAQPTPWPTLLRTAKVLQDYRPIDTERIAAALNSRPVQDMESMDVPGHRRPMVESATSAALTANHTPIVRVILDGYYSHQQMAALRTTVHTQRFEGAGPVPVIVPIRRQTPGGARGVAPPGLR